VKQPEIKVSTAIGDYLEHPVVENCQFVDAVTTVAFEHWVEGSACGRVLVWDPDLPPGDISVWGCA
jgi:hypothetical protein